LHHIFGLGAVFKNFLRNTPNQSGIALEEKSQGFLVTLANATNESFV